MKDFFFWVTNNGLSTLVPEAFHARFPVSVKSKKVTYAASLLVSSAFGRRNEAPRRTREKTSGTHGTIFPNLGKERL